MTLKQLPTLFVQAALVATAAVLAIVLVTKYVAPLPLSITQTTTNKDQAFTATGKSSLSTEPDEAQVTLGITRKENDLKTAQSNANEIISNLTNQLVALGIKKEDIKTQNYNISPNYDYQSATQKIVGYSVEVSVVVSLKQDNFDKLNKVVDTGTAAGANQVGNVSFQLSDVKEKEIRKQARGEAINDAKQNAEELARLSGIRLGRVINVYEDTVSPERPIPMFKTADLAVGASAQSAPTQIQPGSTLYNYSVTLSYETL